MLILFILFLSGCHWCHDDTMAVLTALMFWRPAWYWLKSIWLNRHKKPNCVHSQECESNIIWHHHVFAKRCTNEIHGRFDAIEDSDGKIYVLNVGTKKRAFNEFKSREEAIHYAELAAHIYDKMYCD